MNPADAYLDIISGAIVPRSGQSLDIPASWRNCEAGILQPSIATIAAAATAQLLRVSGDDESGTAVVGGGGSVAAAALSTAAASRTSANGTAYPGHVPGAAAGIIRHVSGCTAIALCMFQAPCSRHCAQCMRHMQCDGVFAVIC